MKMEKFEEIREAIADYIRSEGCMCCEDDDHDKHKERLAKLLNIPKGSDGYYIFSEFQSKEIGDEEVKKDVLD